MNLIRTDLAVEAAEPYRDRLPDGVSITEDERAGVKLTRVEITKPEAAERLGRPCGRYITLELPAVSSSVEPAGRRDPWPSRDELSALLPAEGSVLVVGLGNEQITPDALGPRAAHQVLATRHIPAQLAEQTGLSGRGRWPPSRPACSGRRALRRASRPFDRARPRCPPASS